MLFPRTSRLSSRARSIGLQIVHCVRSGEAAVEDEMLFVRSKLFDAFLTVWTLLLFAGAFPVLMMLGRQSTYVRKVTYAWLKGILVGLKYIVGLDYVERGRENIPCEPCLIIANHQSS